MAPESWASHHRGHSGVVWEQETEMTGVKRGSWSNSLRVIRHQIHEQRYNKAAGCPGLLWCTNFCLLLCWCYGCAAVAVAALFPFPSPKLVHGALALVGQSYLCCWPQGCFILQQRYGHLQQGTVVAGVPWCWVLFWNSLGSRPWSGGGQPLAHMPQVT